MQCVNKIPLFDNITWVHAYKILIIDCRDNKQSLVTLYYVMRMLNVFKSNLKYKIINIVNHVQWSSLEGHEGDI